MTTSFDVIVVGAGGVGTAAAYHLARAGRRVLLLEQFRLGHNRGSSHGGSRIIRHSHAEREYASLAPAAFALWRDLEEESGVPLLQETGGLDFGPPDFPALVRRMRTMSELDVPHQILASDEVRRRYPQFRLPDGWVALEQANAGILSASRAVETLAAQAVRHGATLQEESRVLTVEPEGEGVAVQVAGPGGIERIRAAQVVVSAGPWAGHFFRQLGLSDRLNLPFKVTHQQVVYFAVEPTAVERFLPAVCPLYIFLPLPHFYGFPIWERPGHVKIGLELAGEGIDPDTHDRAVRPEAVAELCDVVARYLVGVIPSAVDAEACLYTHSPDQNFVVDRHPEHPQILLAGGLSGRGFKFALLLGRLLADLATSEPGTYGSPLWRERFRIDRFASAESVTFQWDQVTRYEEI